MENNLHPETVLQGSKYKITKMLGQGGFGITYAGIQTGLNRPVAIKEFYMRDFCSRDASMTVTYTRTDEMDTVRSFQQKFLKEARLIADLQHSNIVKIIDVFEENNTAYYVMEHIAGGSLQDYVEQHGPLPEQKALSIIRQVASALDHVHQHKILHLDVKPANVMLRDDGTAVLIDFGISKHYTDSGTQTTTSLGGISRGYAPMEQYAEDGVAKFSPATDIYSLGATLYFMLSGARPPEPQAIVSNGLSPLPGHISAATQSAVRKAMHPQRNQRPQTVTAFLSNLNSNRSAVGQHAKQQKQTKKPMSFKSMMVLLALYAVTFCIFLGICAGIFVGINVLTNYIDGLCEETQTYTVKDEAVYPDGAPMYYKYMLIHEPSNKTVLIVNDKSMFVTSERDGYASVCIEGKDDRYYQKLYGPDGQQLLKDKGVFGQVYLFSPGIICADQEYYDLDGNPTGNLATFANSVEGGITALVLLFVLFVLMMVGATLVWKRISK